MTKSAADQPEEVRILVVEPESKARSGVARAYFELFRLPNVFTALADVLLGFFFTHPITTTLELSEFRGLLALLLGASAFLYTAGMVLNDFFDADVDARERPRRPIPSGRVARKTAGWLGLILLLAGVGCGVAAGWFGGGLRSGALAAGLAACVLLYDGILKRTPLGPLAMGGCRMLNVLLGMSAATGAFGVAHYLVAGGVGVYIAGVTIFAKREAEQSSQGRLALGMLVIGAGFALVGLFPNWAAAANVPLQLDVFKWRLVLGASGLLVLNRCLSAVLSGGAPARVQVAVVNALRSLIILDALTCAMVAGMVPAVAIVALFLPMLLLGRWLYST
jgi:4-hydroxybenzoate polyprenyltransferase